MNDLIEMRIMAAVRGLLTGRVNEILGNAENAIPLIELGEASCGYAVVPEIVLTNCERTEKERIIRQDVYSLTITLAIPETPESELHCYAYSGAVSRAVYGDPTLGGVADRAVITGKKYIPPTRTNCGEGWGLAITMRITVEGMKE
ncbi:MAG: hypothetical protein FWF22_09675 [Treponema sp.]|nr:hypothetical protein [Treponema sp.]